MKKKKIIFLMVFLFLIFIFSGKVVAGSINTTITIDYPIVNNKYSDNLLIQGWYLSEDSGATLEIAVDGTVIQNVSRYNRRDVIKLISGYGGIESNPNCGYTANVDISKYDYGKHTVTVTVKSSTGAVITKEDRVFQVKSPDTALTIDYPASNKGYTNSLLIQGWYLSEDSGASLEIAVDGTVIQNVSRYNRRDVIKLISGYGGIESNPNCGYTANVDISKYDYGKHTVTVTVKSSTGAVITKEDRVFQVKSPDTALTIDYPASNKGYTNSLLIQGWYLSEDSGASLEIAVDGTVIQNVSRYNRRDVIKLISGYGGIESNPNCGYTANIDISKYDYGKHTVTVTVKSSTGAEITKEDRTFQVKSPDTALTIDYPASNKGYTNSLLIQGWYLSEDSGASLEIAVDGTVIQNVSRYNRRDVIKLISGYGGIESNPNCGYTANVDISKYDYGKHTVTVTVKSSTGAVITKEDRTFQVNEPETYIYIEKPNTNQTLKTSVTVSGWMMSEDKDAIIEVLVDNKKMESSITRSSRKDVLNQIKNCGGTSTNVNPGFSATFDSSYIKDGTHTITVNTVSSVTGQIIYSTKVDIKIAKYQTYINIDYPSITEVNKTSMIVQGWMMSEDNGASIKAMIDGKEIETLDRTKRGDVLQNITGYGTITENPTPGFYKKVNTSNLTDGTHTLTINVIDIKTGETISSKSKSFKIKKYDGTICLDVPSGSNFSSDFSVGGWEMSELDNSYVKFYMDGSEINTTITRVNRPDVIANITTYGGADVNTTPGFNGNVSIKNYSEGYHNFEVRVYSKLNEYITSVTKRIFISKSKYYGIDISQFQSTINWPSVRGAGIDYAMIRLGYRGYGISGSLNEDSKFRINMNGALSSGIKTGVYFFSQATNELEGVEEAQYVLRTLSNAGYSSKITLPIAIDSETSTAPAGDGRADHISKEARTSALKGFINTIKGAGYTPMIYASTAWLNDNLDMTQLSAADIWVAQWSSNVTYQGTYQIWQYTSSGSVTGINGRVDLDYIYKKY